MFVPNILFLTLRFDTVIGTNRDGSPTNTVLVLLRTNVRAETAFNRPPSHDDNIPVDLVSVYPANMDELRKQFKDFYITSKFQYPSFYSNRHNLFYYIF